MEKAFSRFKIFIAVLYFVGFLLHALDLLDMRLEFSRMNIVWKYWIVFLVTFDLIAAIGLFLKRLWGELTFLLVAFSQLIAYIFYTETFGDQTPLIWFHCIFLTIYGFFKTTEWRNRHTSRYI